MNRGIKSNFRNARIRKGSKKEKVWRIFPKGGKAFSRNVRRKNKEKKKIRGGGNADGR